MCLQLKQSLCFLRLAPPEAIVCLLIIWHEVCAPFPSFFGRVRVVIVTLILEVLLRLYALVEQGILANRRHDPSGHPAGVARVSAARGVRHRV